MPTDLAPPKNADERSLEDVQARIAAYPSDIDLRNRLLAKLADKGMTHRELAERLSRASGVPIVEDTVQKAIRKHREANR